MDFFGHLRSLEVLPIATLNKLRDQAAIDHSTVFREIYRATGTPEELLNFPALVEHFQAVVGQNGQRSIVVENTNSYQLDANVYKQLGGVSAKLAEKIIPLIDTRTEENIMLTSRPDDDGFIEKVKSAYNGRIFCYGICNRTIWASLFTFYVEPCLVSQIAVQISHDTIGTGNSVIATKDSEARRLYQMLINVGITRRASDVHFVPQSTSCLVKYRIDGHYHPYTEIPVDILEKICNILKNDGQMPTMKPHEPIDGKVRYSPSNHQNPHDEVDLRVSIIPSKSGPDLNIRYLSDKKYTFEELGMSPALIRSYKFLLNMPSGMIVQVGPTGSGKTTTLYTGLEYMHKSMRNILTAEDPVEIRMDGITQIDVDGSGKLLSFADALKASLRHDPDVIVVGELRDSETANLAVRASNTGHLVLTSLHTNDSIGAFERLINLGVDPYSLGEVVVAVMGQRLVRRLCPKCKEEYLLSLKSSQARLFRLPNEDSNMRFFRATGCVHCNNTGYVGRIALNEILMVTPEIRNLIQRHALRRDFEEALRESKKFRSMFDDGLSKAQAGITSLEELTAMAQDTIAFKG